MVVRRTMLAIVLMAAATPIAAAQERAFVLPAPTGQLPVGTTSWFVVDRTRRESFMSGDAPRSVEVVAWYPTSAAATARSARAPYLREGSIEAETFAKAMGKPGVFDHLAAVQTHSVTDAPPSGQAASLPLLLFSHGYTGPLSAYAALLEDLASHGYIVLSVGHSYEAVAVRKPDGSVATMLDSSGAMRQRILDVLTEWRDEDSTMARVTRAPTESEQLQILKAYISGVPKTEAVINRWVADNRFVLDQFARSAAGIAGELRRRADLTRIGVFGHSMGGVVAGEFCLVDERCRAGLNLDGIPQSGSMIGSRMPRPFMMVYSARPGRLGASDVIYRRAASPYYRVDVDGTRHIDFSDMIFWGGPLKAAGASGNIAPERAVEATRLIVRQYFDQELRGVPSPLLKGTLRLDDVHVRSPSATRAP
jgi:alpha-beta hydrolase superfamily lysophospholipase